MRTTMKAIVMDSFGGPDQLRLAEVPVPQPGPKEVLVQVAFASVNPVDWKIRQGHLTDMLPHQFPIIPGWDVSGTIVQLGDGASSFTVGQRVFAYARKPVVQNGTYAEYVTLDETAVAQVPRRLTMAEAASIPLTGLTAWQALVDIAQIKPDQTVLVHAGAGGVGGLAIQIAKSKGAKVISTASAKNHPYVKELGADVVIDYLEDPFAYVVRTLHPEGVDVVFDCAGGLALKESYSIVKRGGTLVGIVDPPDEIKSKELGIKSQFLFVSPSGKELAEIGALIEAGKIRPLALEVFPLEQAALAQTKNETRRQRGKIVLKVFGE